VIYEVRAEDGELLHEVGGSTDRVSGLGRLNSYRTSRGADRVRGCEVNPCGDLTGGLEEYVAEGDVQAEFPRAWRSLGSSTGNDPPLLQYGCRLLWRRRPQQVSTTCFAWLPRLQNRGRRGRYVVLGRYQFNVRSEQPPISGRNNFARPVDAADVDEPPAADVPLELDVRVAAEHDWFGRYP
jgi:hypothetical protein